MLLRLLCYSHIHIIITDYINWSILCECDRMLSYICKFIRNINNCLQELLWCFARTMPKDRLILYFFVLIKILFLSRYKNFSSQDNARNCWFFIFIFLSKFNSLLTYVSKHISYNSLWVVLIYVKNLSRKNTINIIYYYTALKRC